jgi:hypothetical protein
MRSALLLLLALACTAQAQRRNDPLNDREIDAMREHAQDPPRRIELMVGFARQRVAAIERERGAAHPDAGHIGALLTELAALVDELDDNLEMYNNHSEDLRHPLRVVLEAEGDFLRKLDELALQATPLQKREFGAALEDARESIRVSRESAQAMRNDQVAKKGEEKEKKKEKGAARDDGEHSKPDYTGMGGVGQQPPQRCF